jgi:hypothetical protein
VQTIVSIPTPTSPSGSGNGGGGAKTNVAGIVGGVLGAIVLIAILLAVFLWWLPRRQKRKAQFYPATQPAMQGAEGSTFVPSGAAAAVVRKPVGGRAELPEKMVGAGTVGEKEVIVDTKKEPFENVVDRGVEIDGRGAQGRYGLRPEELDSEGRYVGELHGDGRHGVELQGSEVR